MKQALQLNKKLFLMLTLIFFYAFAQAQVRTISGTVTDSQTNESLPGASVLVKGTNQGISTDINGKFSLTVNSNTDILVVSFIGYESTEITVGSQSVLSIMLSPSKTNLEEVVVVGYGTSKVKDLTSSITTVKSDDLMKTPAAQPMQALQGKVAGLQVIANGEPGSASTIRIRGIGSFPGRDNEAPLFVVDGMFFDNIDFLNTADIASISVLKDASAAAIYGVRAANGVVLIETKSGTYNQKSEITYDGYEGYQVAQNIVKMANAEQFTTMAIESGSEADATFILNAMQRYGRSRINPNVPDVNTDWYSQVLRPARITNHSLGFNGGNDKAKYSLGANYFYQDGILKMKNSFERLNLRSKIDFKVNDWITIGGNFIYSTALKYNDQSDAWNQAYFAVPILPVYDELLTEAFPTNYANAQDLGYRSGQNPFPTLNYNDDRMKIKKLLSNMYLELNLIPQVLTFRTTYNNNLSLVDQRVVNLPYFIGNSFQNPDATLTKTNTIYTNQIWDNILTFTKSVSDHNFTLMAGTSYKDEGFQLLTAQGKNFDTDIEQSWYLAQSGSIVTTAVRDDGGRQYGMSYFSRLAYNFKNKYLLYGTIRADGSNKYQQKWGYFPTVGAGWVVTEEKFLKGTNAINFLKLRGSWGQLGNDHIQASDGQRTTNFPKTTLGGVVYTGSVAANYYSELKWEITEETNLGFTARFLKERLSVDFDYYIRDTKNAAIPVTVPMVGVSIMKPVGVIRNSGIEMALNWSDDINNKLKYSIGANISTLKNEVIDLYGQQYIDGGTAEFRQRTYVGEPVMAFYGREIVGVYQTQDEVDHDLIAIENGLVPGDFKYKDQNNDNKINDDDRVLLGSYFPSLMYGVNLSVTYMNFDLTANLFGQSGNKILNRKRGELIWTADGNLDADLAINRWHGEGTSNEYPSSAGLRKGWNQKMSDYFVEDGSFFRIQNVQIGYTIKNKKWFGGNFPVTRINFTADRPLTVFSYNGFTPEVANGWDTQTYPVPAVYTVGLNVKF
ncbi:MAG: TonB-dependent receptor [Bacteroidales bacterium]|nr:TonB-dependent receptor [Bacteroidales bacterium]